MTDIENIVQVAVDGYKGKVEKFSVNKSQELIRKALIEANGGSTVLDYKRIRDGKCTGLFSLVEQLINATTIEGLQGDEYFNSLIQFINVPEGDKNVFQVEDRSLFVVADGADGTQGIRRQRIGGVSEVSIPTSYKYVRVYDDISRILAGRVDFNQMVDKVSESFKQRMLNDAYTLWSSATAEQLGGATYFPVAGSYNEDTLLDLISHVEAAAGGKKATIIGTKKALRNLKDAISADEAKSDLYNLGYCGKFYGSPVVVVPQRHKVGSTEFTMDDNILTIIAGDDKPIKLVYEGNPIMLMGDPMSNADLTQEYFYGEKYGIGLILAGGNSGIGRYETT